MPTKKPELIPFTFTNERWPHIKRGKMVIAKTDCSMSAKAEFCLTAVEANMYAAEIVRGLNNLDPLVKALANLIATYDASLPAGRGSEPPVWSIARMVLINATKEERPPWSPPTTY